MKNIVTCLAVLCMSFVAVGVDAPAPTTTNVKELQEEVARLKSENEALRRENQRLRAQLVERGPEASSASVQSSQTAGKDTAQEASGEYWLTTSSKKRHNSKCRYYKKSKGRPCGKEEGAPCKSCGG